jgi:hypothetical protein
MSVIDRQLTTELGRRAEVWRAAVRKAQAAMAELKYAERAYIAASARERSGAAVVQVGAQIDVKKSKFLLHTQRGRCV